MLRTVRLMLCACALLSAWWPLPALAQEARTLSLDEAQRLSVANYEAIKAARERTVQAREAQRGARSALMPQVVTAANLTNNLVTGSFEFSGQRIDILPAFDYNLVLTAVQPIYSGLKTLKAKRQAEIGVDVATEAFGLTLVDTVLDTTRAYYEVLAAQDNLEISRRSVAVNEETVRSAESLYRAGEAVETSVLRARVALSDAQRELVTAENLLVLSKERLSVMTDVEGDFQVTRPVQPDSVSESVDELIGIGLQNRRELKTLALQRRIAELEIEKRFGDYLPTVDAEASFLRRRANFPSTTLGSLAINATWTLFNGGRTGAGVAAARSQLRELEAQEGLARKQTELQIRTAYLAVRTLRASVDLLRSQVELARRNADQTGRAFRVGEATDLDVLQANTSQTQSERQLALTSYLLDVGIYELQRAAGLFAADLVPDTAGGTQ